MKKQQYRIIALVLLLLMSVLAMGTVTAQDADEVTFTVRVENVSGQDSADFRYVGIFSKPQGADRALPISPGQAYVFDFKAQPGDHLSFATLFAESNDTFFAPAESGIALYGESGSPLNGDVSDQIYLWDAGTEVNEPLGEGENQPPRQPSPNTGESEDGVVQQVSDEFDPAPDYMRVTISVVSPNVFRVQIDNRSGSDSAPTVFSPGVFVVHTADQAAPLFTAGEADRGQGLEILAEDGNPEALAASLAGSTADDVSPSPLIYVVTPADQTTAFLANIILNQRSGFEKLAEDGDPLPLGMIVAALEPKAFGVIGTPTDGSEAGSLLPGQAYEFDVTLSPDDRLWVAFMFGQSNDLLIAPDEDGIALFAPNNNMPLSGPITGAFILWDIGSEVNEAPFVGPNQAPRQPSANSGVTGSGIVQPVVLVNDGFVWPSVLSSIQVSVEPHERIEATAEATESP